MRVKIAAALIIVKALSCNLMQLLVLGLHEGVTLVEWEYQSERGFLGLNGLEKKYFTSS